jgi:hypothetical protein
MRKVEASLCGTAEQPDQFATDVDDAIENVRSVSR